MGLMERRKKERKTWWEVVDVELAHIFLTETAKDRDATKAAVELMNHRVVIREIEI